LLLVQLQPLPDALLIGDNVVVTNTLVQLAALVRVLSGSFKLSTTLNVCQQDQLLSQPLHPKLSVIQKLLNKRLSKCSINSFIVAPCPMGLPMAFVYKNHD
jgi:hypothetical protein